MPELLWHGISTIMFSGEKLWVGLMAILLIGVSGYVVVSKLNQEVSDAAASPTPIPSAINSLFNTPASALVQSPQPQVSELPFSKNKQLKNFPGILKPEQLQNKKVIIQTAKGTIQLEIYPEATKAASNFMILASNGFYDGLSFHRVEPGFVIQGGNPAGNGSGGPGYVEIETNLFGKFDKGIVAYAKRADEPKGTFGSQFFIMLEDKPLPLEYAIFGKVIQGMDVVEKIQVGDVMQKVVIQNLK